MSAPAPQGLALRRAVVALDASPYSLAVLEATALMAALLKLELVGIFVEDENLLRLADLPVTWEVGARTATVRSLDSGQVARQFRALSTQMRRTLVRCARRAGVAGNFRVARGAIVPELLALVEPTDLLGMGRMGWPLSRRPRLGSTTQAMLERSVCPVYIPGKGAQEHLAPLRQILVLFDGSPAGERGVLLGVSLAQAARQPLAILLFCPPTDADPWPDLRSQAKGLLDKATMGQIERIDIGGGFTRPGQVVAHLNRQGGLAILPQAWSGLVDEVAGAVVVV